METDGLRAHSISEFMYLPDDTYKSFKEIVEANGFVSEEHWVTTEDGFVNLMHRIYKDKPYKEVFWCGPLKEGNDAHRRFAKPVVYMQHGIADSSDTWIVNTKERAPAFVAAEAGYDVWMGNARGNKYSRQHKTLKITDAAYWDNSFVEVAKYDIPAFLECIKQSTKLQDQQKITLVGHSQGTTDFFYGMATNPTYYADNANLLVALGPIARMTTPSSAEQAALKVVQFGLPVLHALGIQELFSASQTRFLPELCGHFTGICQYFIHYVATTTSKPLDFDRFRAYFGHYPAGAGLKSFLHFGQMIESSKF